ncbi:hypothetical protein NPIL_514941 [Nephila pilipes]|uniref:Uncharacterized protein n=1 Tax=Nephila pilipes TaxID=299642 RepID=A0A8X6P6J3_NEPPI|nr:hypothetical protein NPIL_514941 [Nephila pilipes]
MAPYSNQEKTMPPEIHVFYALEGTVSLKYLVPSRCVSLLHRIGTLSYQAYGTCDPSNCRSEVRSESSNESSQLVALGALTSLQTSKSWWASVAVMLKF